MNNVSLVSLLGTGPCQEAGARPARPRGRGGAPAAPRPRASPGPGARAPAACTSLECTVSRSARAKVNVRQRQGRRKDHQPNETRIAYRSVRYSVDSTGTSLIPVVFVVFFVVAQ